MSQNIQKEWGSVHIEGVWDNSYTIIIYEIIYQNINIANIIIDRFNTITIVVKIVECGIIVGVRSLSWRVVITIWVV